MSIRIENSVVKVKWDRIGLKIDIRYLAYAEKICKIANAVFLVSTQVFKSCYFSVATLYKIKVLGFLLQTSSLFNIQGIFLSIHPLYNSLKKLQERGFKHYSTTLKVVYYSTYIAQSVAECLLAIKTINLQLNRKMIPFLSFSLDKLFYLKAVLIFTTAVSVFQLMMDKRILVKMQLLEQTWKEKNATEVKELLSQCSEKKLHLYFKIEGAALKKKLASKEVKTEELSLLRNRLKKGITCQKISLVADGVNIISAATFLSGYFQVIAYVLWGATLLTEGTLYCYKTGSAYQLENKLGLIERSDKDRSIFHQGRLSKIRDFSKWYVGYFKPT